MRINDSCVEYHLVATPRRQPHRERAEASKQVAQHEQTFLMCLLREVCGNALCFVFFIIIPHTHLQHCFSVCAVCVIQVQVYRISCGPATTPARAKAAVLKRARNRGAPAAHADAKQQAARVPTECGMRRLHVQISESPQPRWQLPRAQLACRIFWRLPCRPSQCKPALRVASASCAGTREGVRM